MRALEMAGTVDDKGRLHLDQELPDVSPGPVRVIVLLPEEAEISEEEWLYNAARSTAFSFLNDPSEDIYTLADGRPFNVEG